MAEHEGEKIEKRGRGRPPAQWKEEQAKTVRLLSGLGIKVESIAAEIGMGHQLMYRLYREDIEKGKLKANAAVAQSLYQAAINGNVGAAIFLAKTQMGWRETSRVEHVGSDGPAIKMQFEGLSVAELAEIADKGKGKDGL